VPAAPLSYAEIAAQYDALPHVWYYCYLLDRLIFYFYLFIQIVPWPPPPCPSPPPPAAPIPFAVVAAQYAALPSVCLFSFLWKFEVADSLHYIFRLILHPQLLCHLVKLLLNMLLFPHYIPTTDKYGGY
jgi:hypothetical protein